MLQALLEQFLERSPVGQTLGIAAETVVVGQLGQTEYAHQVDELFVGADRYGDRAILGAEGFVGRNARVCVSHSARRRSGGERARRLVDHAGQQRGEQVHLHALPLPGAIAHPQ